jgi:transposase
MTSKKIKIHSDYTKFSSGYQLSLALDFPIMIPKNEPVRLLNEILEGLDYTKLEAAYSEEGRNPAVPPTILFKILVYAYMKRAYSSRDIAALCKENINFIWLLQGYPAPSHNTIARFRSKRLAEGVMENLFGQFVEALFNLDEITFENLFIDGTKIEANANRYSFVWIRAVSKFQARMYEKIESFVPIYEKRYGQLAMTDGLKIVDLLKMMHTSLSKLADEKKVAFVYGKGKRKSQLQRDIEQVFEWLEKEGRYLNHIKTAKGRSSYSKTDIDASFMILKDDHMKNGQLKPAYNVQIGVEAEYIVHVGLYPFSNDLNTLKPFLTSLEERFNEKYKNIIADAGYESEENYMFLKDNEYTSYIKPANHEQMKTRTFKKQIGRRENMTYDESSDYYVCAQGRKLVPVGTKTEKSKTGYQREVTIYECETCKDCPVRAQCTKAKPENNKRLSVSKNFIALREESQENITTDEGVKLRMNRSIQVEGAFGVLKQDYGFRRFLTRGNSKVSVEFLLLCFAYNVKKLHNKIQNGRCGQQLHEKKVA